MVWCAGLPKSGTTLIEEIFDELPYARLDFSPLRIFIKGKLDHRHAISEEMFRNVPKNKYTFLKTHTHYDKKYENIGKKFNAKIIISLRDIRDMMISRYYHILADKKHWQNSAISNLSTIEGFKKSLVIKNNSLEEKPIEYYYNWIKEWINISKNRNYLILWFEDYTSDPIIYINKILQYLQIRDFTGIEIEKKLKNNLRTKQGKTLKENISKYGKMKSTMRKGFPGEWKSFFDEDISSFFNESLPGPLNHIIKD